MRDASGLLGPHTHIHHHGIDREAYRPQGASAALAGATLGLTLGSNLKRDRMELSAELSLDLQEDGDDDRNEDEIDLEPFRSEKSNSGYRGVFWNSSNQKYQAGISVNGRHTHLGTFDTVAEAAQVYARAYLREHGGPPAPPAPSVCVSGPPSPPGQPPGLAAPVLGSAI